MPTIATNGAELNYRLDGPDGAPVVAFSNSLGTTFAMWDAQVAALSGAFRCLRYDTRGHGGSSLPTKHVAINDLAADLAGLLAALGIARAHVVGLSLGGMTGQALAATRPELVERLVLVATAAHLPPQDLWLDRAAMVRASGMKAVAQNVVQRWFTPPNQAGEGAQATLHRLLHDISPEGYAACCEAIGEMDLRPQIGAIGAPTLVVSGADDPATPPAMGEEIARLVPGAAFVTVPDTAHMIAVERPEALNALLDAFLHGRPLADPPPRG